MTLLKLALMFVRAYCEKHMTCSGCRMYIGEECKMQMIDYPPQDWDLDEMVRRPKV